MRANGIALALLLGMLVWLAMHAYLVEWEAAKLAGAVLAGVSLLLLVAARVQLGGAFSVRAKATTLVTTGLYAKIRNPVYVFGELLLVAMAVVLSSRVLQLLAVLQTPVQVMRARKEEAALRAAFGEEYARYKAGTWF
jgi:protein-S-isoprenylcysteine O-methyltransferase Ste14